MRINNNNNKLTTVKVYRYMYPHIYYVIIIWTVDEGGLATSGGDVLRGRGLGMRA